VDSDRLGQEKALSNGIDSDRLTYERDSFKGFGTASDRKEIQSKKK
jgi:hypothetical protein